MTLRPCRRRRAARECFEGRTSWVTLERTVIAMCAVVSGVADKAPHPTAHYTTERAVRRAIGTFQAVGQRMADCYIDNQAIEPTMLQAATHLDAVLARRRDRGGDREVLACDGGSRIGHAAARARRHQHRRRLPDPPVLPVAEAGRVLAGLGDARAAADRQGPRRDSRPAERSPGSRTRGGFSRWQRLRLRRPRQLRQPLHRRGRMAARSSQSRAPGPPLYASHASTSPGWIATVRWI